MERETATHKYDLPHRFEQSAARGICKCTSELPDPIHNLTMLPEQAASRIFITEKGV